MKPKSFDEKLALLKQDATAEVFILADAKDADMAFGLSCFGTAWPEATGAGQYRSRQEHEELIDQIVAKGLVDIVLMSAHTADSLVRKRGVFEGTRVTPAVRMNDTTDIWLAGTTQSYADEPSLPFATTTIAHAMHGSLLRNDSRTTSTALPGSPVRSQPPQEVERREEEGVGKPIRSGSEMAPGVDLGLYSITLNHDAQRDRNTLHAYSQFRHEAELAGFRHFLEVFPPNAPQGIDPGDLATFVANSIVRLLAGVVESERPQFLKVPYLGPHLTTSLCEFDSTMPVGIMGGSSGTTHDAFHLLAEARRSGARLALYGRKINAAEDQLLFVQHLRWVADGEMSASEAVHSYHSELAKKRIPPRRALSQDLELTGASAGLDAATPRANTLYNARAVAPGACDSVR